MEATPSAIKEDKDDACPVDPVSGRLLETEEMRINGLNQLKELIEADTKTRYPRTG
jgi:hypothetical protein